MIERQAEEKGKNEVVNIFSYSQLLHLKNMAVLGFLNENILHFNVQLNRHVKCVCI